MITMTPSDRLEYVATMSEAELSDFEDLIRIRRGRQDAGTELLKRRGWKSLREFSDSKNEVD